MQISAIPALDTNYYWLIQPRPDSPDVYLVDLGDAQPVLDTLAARELNLRGVLITHHHWDHTDGLDELLGQLAVPVYGPEHIPQVNHPLAGGDTLELPGLTLELLAIPGHTLDHLAYIHRPADGPIRLFCGDTLFAAGCGRLFEGTPTQMLASLHRLASLPDDTLIYCGHEYTLANLAFAAEVEPNNTEIGIRRREVAELRDRGLPSLPALIGAEKATNPFLRCHLPSLRASAEAREGKPLPTEIEVFTAVRRWKDRF